MIWVAIAIRGTILCLVTWCLVIEIVVVDSCAEDGGVSLSVSQATSFSRPGSADTTKEIPFVRA